MVKHYNLHEVHSYIWGDVRRYKKLGIEVEDNVKVLNIESSDNGTLRNSMIPTLLTAVSDNKDFKESFGIFEIGRVVKGLKTDGTANEKRSLGIVLFDKKGSEKHLYFKALNIVNTLILSIKHKAPEFNKITPAHAYEHPKNTAEILCDNVKVGVVNTLHPAVAAKLDKTGKAVCIEIDVDDLITISNNNVEFVEPSTQQSTYYDLSLDVSCGAKFSELKNCWETLNLTELTSVNVIDTFEKDGVKSIAVRFIFSSKERTLEMEEVQRWIDSILENLSKINVVLKK